MVTRGCHERVFAVTRVEERVIEAANASLLGVHKEGQSDPDLPPWTPTIHHPSSATNHESATYDWDQADDHWPVPQHGVPLSPTARYPSGL